MKTTSILGQEEIAGMLTAAKRTLNEGHTLPTFLCVYAGADQRFVTTVTLPDGAETRARLFFGLGRHFHEQRTTPLEAVIVSESWFVKVQETPAAMQFAPSEHPARQEAIVAIGRSADNRRYTQVVQPFERDKDNHPIWLPIPLAMYNTPREAQDGPFGLLDYFFAGIPNGA